MELQIEISDKDIKAEEKLESQTEGKVFQVQIF